MPATALEENYCVCVGDDGSPRELGRSGAAVTYKAMGYQSGQAVALQLIPLSSVSDTGRAQFEAKARAVRKLKHPNVARVFETRVEDDHIVFASEYVEGETAEAWVVERGPMPPDAVVRIGLQVVSALAEAAFHSLSHRAIQPSNLMIVNGAAPDGGWPFVKLLNFGLAGLRLYSEGPDELAPSIGPAFGSPEQMETGKVDFRSEIFSLGATMCFLLTGAVPVAGRARRSGDGERLLPRGAPIPRSLRRILRRMLRINPQERPQDPIIFTDELRSCLEKLERRRANTRPGAVLEPLEFKRRSRIGPVLAAAAALLLFCGLGAVLLPERVRAWVHRDQPLDSIGVPVGVPETRPAETQPAAQPTPAAIAQNSAAPIAATGAQTQRRPEQRDANSTAPSTAVTDAGAQSATVGDESGVHNAAAVAAAQQNATAAPSAQSSPVAPPVQIAANRAEPAPPAEAPPSSSTEPSPPQNGDDLDVLAGDAREQNNEDGEMKAEPAPATPAQQMPRMPVAPPETKFAKSTAKSARASTAGARRASKRSSGNGEALPVMRVGNDQARFVGTTGDGKWLLELPSGRKVVTPPLPDVNDAPVISHHRVRKVAPPRHALPANDLAPVVVLPPEN
ncbi:MAG: protein kinase [Verrucomicrobia bacterium]|nr:protein kinase [Verrucomicrobiota bacterium]